MKTHRPTGASIGVTAVDQIEMFPENSPARDAIVMLMAHADEIERMYDTMQRVLSQKPRGRKQSETLRPQSER